MIPSREVAAPPFDAHSPEARAIAGLFTQTLVVCGVILVVVSALVAICVVRFRATEGAKEPAQVHGHKGLEIAWTLLPIVIVAVLLFLTVRTMAASDTIPNRPPDLIVIAHQWWWEVRYPSGAVSADEVHIPAGRDVLLELQSADVIHDFWVPQLARKIDATPGHPTHLMMQADEPGTYIGTCAEYCGTEHAWMRIEVIAQTQADFDAWQTHQLERATTPVDDDSDPMHRARGRTELERVAPSAQGGSASRGFQTFHQMTCARCHAVASAGARSDLPRVAPDLTHFAGRDTLAAGLLVNNPENLARWLKDPQALKPGSHMPSLQLSRQQVADLVAYLETLK